MRQAEARDTKIRGNYEGLVSALGDASSVLTSPSPTLAAPIAGLIQEQEADVQQAASIK